MSNTSDDRRGVTINVIGSLGTSPLGGWSIGEDLPTPIEDARTNLATWDDRDKPVNRAELERLRAEVIALRGEVAALRAQLMNRTTDRDETVYNTGDRA